MQAGRGTTSADTVQPGRTGETRGEPRHTRIFTRLAELKPDTGEIVWSCVQERTRYYHHKFFSFPWRSVQRLPNGNTFSLDSNRGRLFEVTSTGHIVWEYVNPFMAKMQWGKSIGLETGVYRAYRIPYEQVPDFSSDFAYSYDGEPTSARHPGNA